MKKIKRQALSVGLVAATLVVTGCGGGGGGGTPIGTQQNQGSQRAAIFLKDAPVDDAATVRVTVTSVRANNSGAGVSLSSLSRSYEIRHLQLSPTMVADANIPEGTYTGLTLTLSSPSIQVINANGTISDLDPTTTPSVSLASTTVTVPAAFTLARDGRVGLMVDFNLKQSLSTDASGNFIITPTLTATTTAPTDTVPHLSSSGGTASNIANGAFDLALFDSGTTVRIVTNTSTTFDTRLTGGFSGITNGSVVEVDATYQTDGTFIAKLVAPGVAPAAKLQGVVAGKTTDGLGNTLITVTSTQ